MISIWTSFLDWVSRRPQGMGNDIARLVVLARVGYPVGLLLHVSFAIIFWHLGIWPLVYFNLASSVLWIVASWRLVRHDEIRWTFVACCLLEIPAHGVLATYFLGNQSGFFLFIITTITLSVLTPFFTRRMRIILSLIYVVIMVVTGTAAIINGPVYPLPAGWTVFFFALNAGTLATMMGAFLALFEWRAATNEAKLVKSNRRTEQANRSLESVSGQLAKYISPQLYRAIVSGEKEVKVESRRKKLTIFFSDIVGFTETTDQLQSEELTKILNQYLTEMSVIAQEYGANFDKFIGDAIVLYFGDPESLGAKQDAAQCVRMAIAMQRRMRTLQGVWRDLGLERPFELRIGINTGFCTVGNFGSEERMDYTIIGGEVNLASRLESHSEVGGILLANETYSLVKDWLMAEQGEAITVKGFAKPVTTYRVRGLYDDLAANGRIIHHRDPAVSLTIDTERLDPVARLKAVEVLENALDDLRKP